MCPAYDVSSVYYSRCGVLGHFTYTWQSPCSLGQMSTLVEFWAISGVPLKNSVSVGGRGYNDHGFMVYFRVFAKIRYTWAFFCLNQLYSKNKYKTHPRSPAIGQTGIVTVLQLFNSCCDVYSALFSIITAQQSIQHHGLCLHHPASRCGLRFGTAKKNFVPSRRFREDGLEDLKLSTGGGTRVNTHGTLDVAKQPKPINPFRTAVPFGDKTT